jgi:hypothetical protein
MQGQNTNQIFQLRVRPSVPVVSNDFGLISNPACNPPQDWRFVIEAPCVFENWGLITDPVC